MHALYPFQQHSYKLEFYCGQWLHLSLALQCHSNHVGNRIIGFSPAPDAAAGYHSFTNEQFDCVWNYSFYIYLLFMKKLCRTRCDFKHARLACRFLRKENSNTECLISLRFLKHYIFSSLSYLSYWKNCETSFSNRCKTVILLYSKMPASKFFDIPTFFFLPHYVK